MQISSDKTVIECKFHRMLPYLIQIIRLKLTTVDQRLMYFEQKKIDPD